MKYKKLVISSLLSIVFLFGALHFVSSNPVFFPPTCQTSTATSTGVLISVSNSSSLTCDSYTNAPRAAEGMVLLLQSTASSSSSVLNVAFQYSQDGIDYYNDNLFTQSVTASSTAVASTSVDKFNIYTFTAPNVSLQTRAIAVPTPTRFVKAVFTGSGATTTVWAQLVPRKQQAE